MPIELDGTTAWVINAEARDTYVFFGPDGQLLQSLVCKIREVLDGRFRAVLTEHILDLTEQGIIVVDAKGRIRRANRTAEAFLGAPAAALLDRTLSEFAADGQSSEVLEGTEATVSRHVHLLTASGKASAFLASRSCLGEEYDHKIWLLTDVQQLNWNVELRYLRATVNEVAQQTRVPLLFAGSLVQRARQRLAGTAVEPEVGEFVDKAMEQLGKVGITYERLAANLTLRDGSQSMAGFDVHALLRSIQKELPNTDRPFVDLPPTGGSLVVEGQIDQFHFVFRSILFFLLNRRPLDAHVRVNLEREAEYALVELVAPYAAKDPPADVSSTNPIYRATAEARLVAALAPEAIRSVVEGHGGRFVGPIPRGSEIAFQVRLPAQAGDFL